MSSLNFLDGCASGEYLQEEIDDFIDEWHYSDSDLTLWEFLGFSRPEYDLWLMDHGYLPFIISAKAKKMDFKDEMEGVREFALAARSTGRVEGAKIVEWLKKNGYVGD